MNDYSISKKLIFIEEPKEEYKSLYYRKKLLSMPADETEFSRFMYSVAVRNRRFAIDQVKSWKLKPMKDNIHLHLLDFYGKTMVNALEECQKINVGISDKEFMNGFGAHDWNSSGKYPTIFDTMSEAVEYWHRYHLGVSNILDKDLWIKTTGDKLKWPKGRYGTKRVQDFTRPLEIRRHFPFMTKSDYEKQIIQDGAGVLRMLGKEIPLEVRTINV